MIPSGPFARLVKGVSYDYKDDIRWSVGAMQTLEEAATDAMVEVMEIVGHFHRHAKRITLRTVDVQLFKDVM